MNNDSEDEAPLDGPADRIRIDELEGQTIEAARLIITPDGGECLLLQLADGSWVKIEPSDGGALTFSGSD